MTAWAEAHPPLFCKAKCKSHANWKKPSDNEACIKACAARHAPPAPTAKPQVVSSKLVAHHAAAQQIHLDLSAIAAKVAGIIAANKHSQKPKKPADPRAAEDATLQASAEKSVEAKEKAMVAAEENVEHHMDAMRTWSKGLEKGGLNKIGLKEYGVAKAMARERRETAREVVPHREHLSSIEESRQLRKAGVSTADITGAFHFPMAHQTSAETFGSSNGGGSFGDGGAGASAFGEAGAGVSGGGGKGFGGDSGGGGKDNSVTDMQDAAKVGSIEASTRLQAAAAVNSLIKAGPHPPLAEGKGGRGRTDGRIKIQVFPGSARPLRTVVDPTSIKFWKTLDSGGVDVDRPAEKGKSRILQEGTGR